MEPMFKPEDIPLKNCREGALRDEHFDIDSLYERVRTAADVLDLPQTSKALVLMKTYHAGQYRKGDGQVPYIAHPLTMACHALALGLPDDILLAATLLHDVVEDCDVRVEELEIGETVKGPIRLLTFQKREGENRHDARARYFDRVKYNPQAAMVKLLDRCNNISRMVTGFSREKMADYIAETEEMALPLLEYVKKTYPEYKHAAFLLEYQMCSVMESIKRLL